MATQIRAQDGRFSYWVNGNYGLRGEGNIASCLTSGDYGANFYSYYVDYSNSGDQVFTALTRANREDMPSSTLPANAYDAWVRPVLYVYADAIGEIILGAMNVYDNVGHLYNSSSVGYHGEGWSILELGWSSVFEQRTFGVRLTDLAYFSGDSPGKNQRMGAIGYIGMDVYYELRTAPTQPGSISYPAQLTDGQVITISWGASSGWTGDVSNVYTIEMWTDANQAWTRIADGISQSATSITVTVSSSWGRVKYRIRAGSQGTTVTGTNWFVSEFREGAFSEFAQNFYLGSTRAKCYLGSTPATAYLGGTKL